MRSRCAGCANCGSKEPRSGPRWTVYLNMLMLMVCSMVLIQSGAGDDQVTTVSGDGLAKTEDQSELMDTHAIHAAGSETVEVDPETIGKKNEAAVVNKMSSVKQSRKKGTKIRGSKRRKKQQKKQKHRRQRIQRKAQSAAKMNSVSNQLTEEAESEDLSHQGDCYNDETCEDALDHTEEFHLFHGGEL